MNKTHLDVGKVSNSVLSALNIHDTDKLVCVRENTSADANFVITNLMQKIFEENGKLCLVTLHNTLGHYQNVGKRLGYDLMKNIQDGGAITIDGLKTLVQNIDDGEPHCECNNLLSRNHVKLMRNLYLEIEKNVRNLLKIKDGGRIYVIIDDVSHLLDLGIASSSVICFVNYCANLVGSPSNGDRVYVWINTHVTSIQDELVANGICHIADLAVEVSSLKTGRSHEVTGVIKVKRQGDSAGPLAKQRVFHYKASDRGVKTFAPGESLCNLYR